MTRRRVLVTVLLLVGVAAAAQAVDLAISVVSLTSPAAPFSDATLTIRTSPGAGCSIKVTYRSGPSRARGLYPQTADGRGRITWRWRVGSSTTLGRWPIVVSCEKGGDRGELRTSFEVR